MFGLLGLLLPQNNSAGAAAVKAYSGHVSASPVGSHMS